jgi:hypothetical protein
MVNPAASPPTAAGHRRRSGSTRTGAARTGVAGTGAARPGVGVSVVGAGLGLGTASTGRPAAPIGIRAPAGAATRCTGISPETGRTDARFGDGVVMVIGSPRYLRDLTWSRSEMHSGSLREESRVHRF